MDLMHGLRSSPKNSLEAFNMLVAENQDDFYTLAFLVIGDIASAERVVQAALMQAYHDLSRGNKKPFDWLVYRALAGAFKQEFQRKGSGSSKGKLISDETHPSALNGLLSLPSDLRLAVALVDVAGLDYEQAAEMLGINVSQVRRRLAQARASMVIQVS
jgi:RNA polymerase sigma-70 factor, ECF subfamily